MKYFAPRGKTTQVYSMLPNETHYTQRPYQRVFQ